MNIFLPIFLILVLIFCKSYAPEERTVQKMKGEAQKKEVEDQAKEDEENDQRIREYHQQNGELNFTNIINLLSNY
ncbi:unnamed protein product [Gordionus sp. m RMFG-2023]